MAEAEWKRFELVIAAIQKQLAPGAVVRHSQKLKGLSGRRRQLDVTISQNIGPFPIFIVLECRRYKRRVGIERVEAFSRKLKDVRASLGVLVTTSAFDEGAKAIAKQDDIMLMTHRQAREADWKALLGENAWLGFIIRRFRYDEVVAVVGDGETVPASAQSVVVEESSNRARTVSELFDATAWPSLQASPVLGSLEVALEADDSTLSIRSGESLLPLRKVLIRGALLAKRHIINLRLAEGEVLESQEGGAVYGRVASEGIDWATALERQPGVEISQEEHDGLMAKPGAFVAGPIDLSKVKKFIRIEVEARKNN